MIYSGRELLHMTTSQLEDLFGNSLAGDIPRGQATGTVLLFPGSAAAEPIARVAYLAAWKGKVFDDRPGRLRNRIGPSDAKLIEADVYTGRSWLDDKECIILDYSKRSFVARRIKDEIREVAPGVFLGLAYWGKRRVLMFVLDFHGPDE